MRMVWRLNSKSWRLYLVTFLTSNVHSSKPFLTNSFQWGKVVHHFFNPWLLCLQIRTEYYGQKRVVEVVGIQVHKRVQVDECELRLGSFRWELWFRLWGCRKPKTWGMRCTQVRKVFFTRLCSTSPHIFLADLHKIDIAVHILRKTLHARLFF